MSDPEYDKALADLRAGFKQLKLDIVQAVHDDLTAVLRTADATLWKEMAAVIASRVWAEAAESAVNGETYPVGALVGWTDMHTANIEGAVRAIVEHLGGEVVSSEREGNFTVQFPVAK